MTFYRTLLSGFNYRRESSSKTKLTAKSFSEDAIYAVTSGKIKPSKHINLGITLKSLTSSKKILNIVNSYGHCCSYNVVEELETEATFASTDRTEICPCDIQLKSDLKTGVAYDNFDRFVETIDGKDTLHDTVGIIFQDISEDFTGLRAIQKDNVQDLASIGKKRRTFDAIIPDSFNRT
ncbi:hypothetical protein ALC57_07897 [Trachymyrmex cornetzi]|uniref:Uncharacterized protein n=1 Tax=Trachymyrmex cornetzi TaxID=471704 RepID=A0A151J7D9_9HYME|nr:hypothetical protein ALC57_07897 [Trachymyrmex cornetzi]